MFELSAIAKRWHYHNIQVLLLTFINLMEILMRSETKKKSPVNQWIDAKTEVKLSFNPMKFILTNFLIN